MSIARSIRRPHRVAQCDGITGPDGQWYFVEASGCLSVHPRERDAQTMPLREQLSSTPASLVVTRLAKLAALRQRHQGGARTHRRSDRRRSQRLPAEPRLLEGRDRQDHRDRAGRGRASAGIDLRLRARHHGAGSRQGAPGCPPRHGGQGEEAARPGPLSPVRSRIMLQRGAAFSRVRGRRFAS